MVIVDEDLGEVEKFNKTRKDTGRQGNCKDLRNEDIWIDVLVD